MTKNKIEQLKIDIVAAAAVLERKELFKAFGHVSARVDTDNFLITQKKTHAAIGVDELVRVSAKKPAGADQRPLETPIHAAIYRMRADVNAICRIHPFFASALATVGIPVRTIHGFGTHVDREVPICYSFTDLVTEDSRALKVAERLGDAEALVLCANGALTVGADMAQACIRALYLEESASLLWHALCVGQPKELSAEEYRQRRIWAEEEQRRAWEYYKNYYYGGKGAEE